MAHPIHSPRTLTRKALHPVPTPGAGIGTPRLLLPHSLLYALPSPWHRIGILSSLIRTWFLRKNSASRFMKTRKWTFRSFPVGISCRCYTDPSLNLVLLNIFTLRQQQYVRNVISFHTIPTPTGSPSRCRSRCCSELLFSKAPLLPLCQEAPVSRL